MISVTKELKTLYKDAMFFHLIHNGFKESKAKIIVERIFNDK